VRALRLILVALGVATAGCGSPSETIPPPSILIASDRLLEVALATGRITKLRILPAPATDLEFDPAAARIGIASLRGAAVLEPERFDVLWSSNTLGIVDAIEFAPGAERAYLLLHPGPNPHESTGDHVLLELALPSGDTLRQTTLSPRAYDLLCDPASGGLYVTDLVGRTVHRVDLASFAVTDHAIGSGAAPRIEPRGAFLRLLLPGLAPGELIAVEDARDLARLWRWAPAREQVEPHPLTGVPPPVLGGGLLPDHHGLWLHTRSEFLRLDADFNIATRTALPSAAADSAAGYRFAAAGGGQVVFLGPAAPARGQPQARATWLDLETGRPGGQRLLELRAGPVALLPAGAPTRAGSP
jgi:hypothetical protein